ncbi:MAG TPA: cupin domain-containing protein [Saprospiraceae bacterium]|nr:cupin domain-containing protein [Saprospiraceae bacterium]
MNNIYQKIPSEIPDEIFDTLLQTDQIRIERIVSKGHTTPTDQWYDQDTDEWVLVIRGAAQLEFDQNKPPETLQKGDFMLIPAHQKHRVVWTLPDTPTIWLAIHFSAE